jgi:hypothetical protein
MGLKIKSIINKLCMSLSVVVLLVFDVRKKDFSYNGILMNVEQELSDILETVYKDSTCPDLISLEKDYNDFFMWAFGDSQRENMIDHRETWKRLHPDLPIPRILKSEEQLHPALNTTCMIMDAYPLYLQHRPKK